MLVKMLTGYAGNGASCAPGELIELSKKEFNNFHKKGLAEEPTEADIVAHEQKVADKKAAEERDEKLHNDRIKAKEKAAKARQRQVKKEEKARDKSQSESGSGGDDSDTDGGGDNSSDGGQGQDNQRS